ncbi:MAG: SAM hydrolase/SAM-dependent halogenase family protein [Candidatus Binataceae bacterium]
MPRAAATPAVIAMLTDFGYRDHYAGVMKGVISAIAPATQVLDLTHGIPAGQIAAGAIALAQSWRFFPPRTIFLAVVDPGVGTRRRAIAIASRAGARFVGPDNGLLWMAAAAAGIESIVELQTARYRLPEPSATFHGRDIFAPAAAWLSRRVKLGALGPQRKQLTRLDIADGVSETARMLKGAVVYVDGFGNLVTNLSRAAVERFAARQRQDRLSVRIGRHSPIAIYNAYAEAPAGAPLALVGSFGMLEIAVRDGNAAARFTVTAGAPVSLRVGTK